ncbi:hypothetical protein VTO42DRAFT_7239 [Malbranchea cinnamomea]
MAPSIPPDGTFFDTLKCSFAKVPIDKANDNAISTAEFLEAAEGLVTLFSLLESKPFEWVRDDLSGNIKKVRARLLAAPLESETLQALVINELKSGSHTASEGLLWLVRGLAFTAAALRHNLKYPSKELAESFTDAYVGTLKKHHNFAVRTGFNWAIKFTPYRKDFYAKLGKDQAKVLEKMEAEVTALEKVVAILESFIEDKAKKW